MRTRRGAAALLVVTLAAAGLVWSQSTPATAADCSLLPTGGLVGQTFGGRSYLIQVPPGLTGPAPLVLSLHGFSANATIHAADSKWAPFAAANRFIVVFPNGAGAPQFWRFDRNSSDVQYLRQLVAAVSASYCVDPRRVHVTGHSNGALMALRMACDAADLFGSAAEYAGGPPEFTGSPCTPSRPISVGIFSSTFDFASLLPFGWITRNTWVTRNGCPKTPQREAGVLLEATRYAPCAGGVEVVWRAYLFQSHNWPIGADANDIHQRMWDLFVRNPLPV